MNLAEMSDRAAAYTAAGLRDYGYAVTADLACQEINNAVATSRQYFKDGGFVGAVYDGAGNLIRSTLRFNHNDIVPVDQQRIDDLALLSAQRSDDRVALYGGILFPILGHFFLESLSRFWPLLWDQARRPDPPPVYFHHWPMLEMSDILGNPLYVASLQAFGLDARNVRVIRHTVRFDRLIVAQPASLYHKLLDRRMAEVFDRIAAHILRDQPRPPKVGGLKLYLTRSRWAEGKRILNEDAIDSLLADHGYEVVHTQALSPAALMTRLTQAATVVASDGSHAHLTAFCRPGTRVVMLDTRPVPSQFAIAALRDFDAFHIPLFDTPFYSMTHRTVDMAGLRPLIEKVI